jgi:1,2-phenylacetyl-CoA epoxidase PaaB subunit
VGGASDQITASDPGDKDMYFDPMEDKVYRHPTFYKLPDVRRPHVRRPPMTVHAAHPAPEPADAPVRYLLRLGDTA